jgi:amidophosphoribosyltransferase
MVLGSKPSDTIQAGTDYMMASESVALVQCGYKTFVDIQPGQAVIIEKGKPPEFYQVHEQLNYAPDIFEYVYFARPDTVIDGIVVDDARRNMGYKLAGTIRKQLGPVLDEVDVVMPIPETSITSALCVAESLGKPYCQGFVKNRYIFRTFIMPNQKLRQKGVRAKLNPMKKKFEGKNVLLVDDSIVRGTTSREIVMMAREAGAKKVIFTSCAPPITNVHIYGIDLASSSELIAHHRSESDIANVIGADAVIYQSLSDLEAACAELSPRDPATQMFEVGVFCGKYVTPVDDTYFQHLERVRGLKRKAKAEEAARQAIIRGLSSDEQIQVVKNGYQVGINGNVVARENGTFQDQASSSNTNGKSHDDTSDESKKQLDKEKQVRIHESQDISLHNLNDYRE